MRLYLSSFGVGHGAGELLRLVGAGRRVAVILNAVDLKTPEKRAISLHQELSAMTELGFEAVEFDLRDYFGSPGVKEALAEFDLLWVRGGNTFVLRRALRQSSADIAIRELVAEDRLVYGGFSAAAAVLAPTLDGIERVDGPDDLPEGYSPEFVREGLGLIPFSIAPHYQSDHSESTAVDGLVGYYIEHHLPFVALGDGEALVWEGDGFSVVG